MSTEDTRKCGSCGYDLRGIDTVSLCPECGADPENIPSNSGSSMLSEGIMGVIESTIAVQGLAAVPDIRNRAKYWMRIAGLLVVGFVFLQFLVTFALIPIGLYRFVLFGTSLFWPTVVIGIMPANVDYSMPQVYRYLRKVVPPSQWCWAIGYALWCVFHLPTEAGTVGGNMKYFWPLLLLHAVAGAGLVGMIFWLHDLALRMELDLAAKRCTIVAIAMATWGVIVFVSPWKQFAANGGGGFQTALYWFYIIVLMLPWYWVLIMFAQALFEFASDSVWSLKYESDLEGRQERIREKREAMDKKNEGRR